MEQVRQEGTRTVKRQIEMYNLDTIIAVGYRINSSVGTAFRIWATARLKEYLVQGYSINQSRLDELGQTIRHITKSRFCNRAKVYILSLAFSFSPSKTHVTPPCPPTTSR